MTTATLHAAPDRALPPVPGVPPGAPTLARHLAACLGILAELPNFLGADGRAVYAAAADALARLPSVPRAARLIDGVEHWQTENGSWIPRSVIHDTVALYDDYARTVATAALHLSGQLARFKATSMAEGQALVELVGQNYGVKVGGEAGNVSFFSYDRQYKVTIARADRIAFGPEIAAAKELLERWVAEEEGSPVLKAVINRAFGLDDAGRIRAAEVFRLCTFDVPGETWAQAMKAIRDAVQIVGKAEYMRVYRRNTAGKYELIPLDLANA
ncbi:DUF3164 family protein [Azospirillum sp. RWY-5-1]|uniref:DUF3164 family protein n=1 Tax=Azospirillum oleiclasticum TaxID=2735135 RepID=A0ABX2TKG1_9PROT|nr:DUF3164 family protein [Azospirillum oleiclasticum]NYZ17034.1 DUF3164 family protein [Azospirillum oleiclasticum]NYZ24522.1 DUF3164 family protein [Azospirillum oleiclasticum]